MNQVTLSRVNRLGMLGVSGILLSTGMALAQPQGIAKVEEAPTKADHAKTTPAKTTPAKTTPAKTTQKPKDEGAKAASAEPASPTPVAPHETAAMPGAAAPGGTNAASVSPVGGGPTATTTRASAVEASSAAGAPPGAPAVEPAQGAAATRPVQLDAQAVAPTSPADPFVVAAGQNPQGGRGKLSSAPRVLAVNVAAREPPVSSPPKNRYPFGLFLDISPLWQTARGFDLFKSNDVSTRIGITGELDLLEVAEKTYLSLDLGWSTEHASDTILGQTLDTELSVNNWTGGARLRKDWHPLFATHVSLLGGASRVNTTIGLGAESKQWVPMGQLGAGFSAMVPGQLTVRPGVLFEGGYVLAGHADLQVASDAADGAMSRLRASVGTLDRSGPYLRIGIFARY